MNHKKSALHFLLLRHGPTAYTGKPNDLTPEGEIRVRQVAKDFVEPWFRMSRITHGELSMVSSPSPRAQYTAEVVAEVLGYKTPIIKRDELQPMILRDPDRALAAYRGLSGRGYIDYETEPVFADPAIFEPPDEVRKRWYTFFSAYIRSAFRSGPRHALFFSHYEVFCHPVCDVFGIVASEATALKHGEPICLSVLPTLRHERVIIFGRFRGQKAIVIFDLLTHTMIPL